MNRKGFTMIEVLIVIAIIAITAGVILSQSKDALGAELQTLLSPTDAVISDIARAIRNDPDQTVVVMIYAAKWTEDYRKIDKVMDEQVKIMAKFVKLGVSSSRVNLLIANKGGLEFDGMPIPASDGIYLYLE